MAQFKDGDSHTFNGVTYVRQNGSWLPQSSSPAIGPAIGGNPAAEHRAEASDARAAAAASREAAAWSASHNPDGTPKVQAPSLLGDPTKTGADYLATLPQNIRGRVQQLLDGRSMLTAREKGQPLGQQLMDAANQADPTFDENASHARYVERSQYTGMGKGSQVVQAANRFARHLGDLYEASNALGGPDLGFAPLSNAATATTNAFRQPKVATYKAILPIIQGEVQKLTKNGTATEAEAQLIMNNLSVNQPADVRYSAMKELSRLGRAQIDPMHQSWQSAWQGSTPPPIPMDIDPTANAVFDAVEQGAPLLKRDNKGEFILPGAGDNAPPPLVGPAGPPGAPPNAPPPIGPGGVPHADYSGMVGGPQQSVATGGYRNQYDPVGAAALSAFIKHGAPYETAAAYAQSHGFNPPPQDAYMAAVAFQQQHPNAKPNVEADRNVPTTFGERVSASPAAAALAGGAAGATAGLSDVAGRSIAGPQWDANRAAMAATNPGSDIAGNVIGGIGGMFAGGKAASALLGAGAKSGMARNALAWGLKNPVKAGVLGDTAYGGIYGASENPDDPWAGAGAGILTAPIASAGGQVVAKGIGAAARGVVDPAVQRLRAAGIPLTVGEVIGGGAKKAQDAMTSVFGPGNMVARRYAEGRQAMNQAAFNQAGGIVRAPINKVGNAGIQALDAAKSRAYSNALDPVSLDLNDPAFIADMNHAMSAGQSIPQGELPQGFAANTIRHYVGNNLQPGGVMSGPGFQNAYRGMSKVAGSASGKVEGHDVGQAIGQAKQALTDILQNQNPGAFEGFQKANSANRHLSVLSDAVNAAKNQVGDNGEPLFTPAQLGTAATANAKRYGSNIGAASGARPFNQLALDSQKVMSSKLPESGTFPRQLMGLALTGGLSGAGGMFGGSQNGAEGAAEGAAIPLSLLTLLGTRRGQQLLTASLLKRGPGARKFGNYMITNPQIGGDLATTGALQFLPQP